MEFEYDPRADVLYIRLGRGKVNESEEIEEGVIVDYDENGKVIGVEILGVRRRKIDLNQIVFEPEKSLPILV
ncbi:MAG: DUF2283 domain-containing protein [Candidatus Diapherotrites archaeon]|nr:DUF2283 domain-containing protein [Candidatus Diapherotrites archaeon]